ncbi:prephenate dehydratase [Deinococcus rubellus]|uniref:prephenate dehydratase n=1 Tax=Deinococcus rubellus TaxID=1889240 RepID=A0ABY5YIH7_9DEIO|nr:prephenate dehydratase [Deinococcus rubellus]UWX64919.1 prephenate dehydratase [Deinococcus rubellus]
MTMSLPEDLLPRPESAVKVAYQGNPGAFSEIAALNTVPEASAHGYATFHEVIEAVSSGRADLGVLPVENSLMGSILQAIDLLVDTDLHVVGEVVVRVSHALMALPGVPLSDVKRVYSQQPALDQCTTFLHKHHLTPVAAHDTAGSAKDLAARGARDEGVIASARAADIYGLEVLQNNIEDEPFNFTRFLVLSHREGLPSTEPYKTSLVFAVRHTPGALMDTLNQLRGLNMSSIVSRPRKDQAWSYLMHIDFEGNADDPEISAALGGLLRKASFAKIIGSYPMSRSPIEP